MVAPDLSGQGIGKWLLAHAESRAPSGITTVGLCTGRHSRRNICLYERAGYSITGQPSPTEASAYSCGMSGQVVQDSIFIRAPAEVVFAILSDPEQHAKIDGSNTVRRLRQGPRQLSAGSTFHVSMRLWGVPYRVTNRVVEFEANRLIAWRHFEPQHWRYELEPSDGGTWVTESFDYTYWSVPGRCFIRVLRWPARNSRAIAQTLLRLKAEAEKQPRH